MEDYLLLNLKNDEINLYKNCFDKNGSPKKIDNIEWQFLNNPKKCAFVKIAFDKGNNTVAAIYAASCIDFKIDSKIETGTQSLDTITDIDYRGKGLFTNLAKLVYKEAAMNNVALVYGFPNGNSVHGFKKKLGWEILDPLPFLIKPLQSRFFLSRFSFLKFVPNFPLSFLTIRTGTKFTLREDFVFPESVNELWKNFSKNIKVAVNRNKTYLDWRYINKPSENYRIAHCYNLENQHLGFIVFTVKDKHGGKIGYIMEMIFNLQYPEAAKYLLKYAILQIKKDKADCILNWCFDHSPNAKIYKNQFFIKMPESLRPIELHFGVCTFKDDLKKIIDNRKNWYLSYSDSDTV